MAGMKSEKVIRLSKSCIGEAEKLAVMGVLDREFLGMGAEVQQFEQALTEFFGRPAVCVINGTAALQLALQACGIGIGDEVLVQSLTYVASFQAISATGATPVACDIDPATLTLDWRDAEKRLTPKTKALMPVHYSGGVGALDEIYAFAQRHGLRVIEDAAHAFGTIYQGKRVGSFGDIACFSFDGIKNITSGEGGCIVTDDEAILERVRDARLLGVEKDTNHRYAGERSWDFEVTQQGWRYHMSNIMAVIGIKQLERFGEFCEVRRFLATQYTESLKLIKGLSVLRHSYTEEVPHIYVVILSEKFDRDVIRRKLLENGIQTGIHYKPAHLLKLYKNFIKDYNLPNTENLFSRLITLPLHADMTLHDVAYVVNHIHVLIDE